MNKNIRMLIVDDSEDDALLVVRELKRGGYKPQFERVATREAMSSALDRQHWDIVITDYTLPLFSGNEALNLIKDKKKDIPFLIVSGKIGEETAVELMKSGACDYIMKDNLSRLVPVIERDLKEADSQREHKKAKEALQKSEERYRRITEAITDYIYTVRLESGRPVRTSHSETCAAVTGYSSGEFEDDPYLWIRMVVEEDHHIVRQKVDEVLSGLTPHSFEHRIIRKDGVMRWVESTFVPHFDVDGGLTSYDGIVRDIHKRKEVEAQVARKSKVLNAISKIFREALTCETEEELGKTCLAVAEELTGSKFGFFGELNDRGLFDTLAVSDPGWEVCRMTVLDARKSLGSMPIRGVDRATIRDGHSRIINSEEEIVKHPDHVMPPEGHPSISAFLGVPLKQAGKTVGMIGLGNREGGYNLEDQENIESLSVAMAEALKSKRAGKALRFSEEKFSKAFRSSPTFLMISTLNEWMFLDVNDAFLEASGYSKNEIIGNTSNNIGLWVNPVDRSGIVLQLGEHGLVKSREVKLRVKSGDILTVLFSAEIIDIEDEPCILGVALDITERKKLENQLLHSQKMEAVGQLAGGIAHDFNNILSAIVNYAYLAKKNTRDEEPNRNNIDQIISLSSRAADITQGLLAFSRKHFINPLPLNLNKTVMNIQKLLTKFIGEDIVLRTELTDYNPVILADSAQIEQIIINLATNARDAMPNGGTLIIETERIELDSDFITAHGFGKPGHYAMLSVSDSGDGMDEETRQKAFEPFFTTKEVGRGTGLGLAIIYGIVKQHDGYITVHSEKGQGTTFKIYFNTIEAEAEEKAGTEFSDLTGKGETILLAEDEEEVRRTSKIILEKFGYNVIESSNGNDAIKRYRKYREQIKLLILDVIMPEKNGQEVYEEVKKTSPEIEAIFISGYSAEIMSRKGVLRDNCHYIVKPILPELLLKKIKDVING